MQRGKPPLATANRSGSHREPKWQANCVPNAGDDHSGFDSRQSLKHQITPPTTGG